MPRKLWPSSRPRETLSGNGYRKEQLARGQLWHTFGIKHKQWYRSKIRRVSPFSCFQGQFGSGNNTVTSALHTAPPGQSASCKLGAALCFCRLSLPGEDYGGATTWVPCRAWPALWSPALSEQEWLGLSRPGGTTSSAGGLSHGTEPSHLSMRTSPVLAELANRRPNKIHQVQLAPVQTFSSTQILWVFPLSEFYLCSQ